MHKNTKYALTAILLAAFSARFAAFAALGRIARPDVWEYDLLALNMLHGKGYIYEGLFNTDYLSYAYPLYPALTALSHMITGGNYLVLGVMHVLLSTAICWVVYMIGRKMFGEVPGLIAAALTAFHPGLIVYSTKLHELTLTSFMMAGIFLLMISGKGVSVRRAALVGALSGLGAMVRPTFIMFLPAYLIYTVLQDAAPAQRVRCVVVAAICAVLVLLPWTARNYIVHKRLIFVTTSSAEHFWRGNSPFSSGTALTGEGISIDKVAPAGFMEKLRGLDEMGQYDLFYGETLRHIRSHPFEFMGNLGRKFRYFWYFSPHSGINYPPLWLALYKTMYWAILISFLAGAVLAVSGAGRAHAVAAISLMLLISFCHSLFYVETRHRWGIEPLMLVFSAYALTRCAEFFAKPANRGAVG